MEETKIIFVAETDSTNRFLGNYQGEEGRLMTIAWTDYQTAGRGQGSNKWESEKGKNLTFSVKVHPKGVPAARQYVMLEAAALAIKDVLSSYVGDITIKWPNDIYWLDKKISGTLSECTVKGTLIKDCIIGTGVNVNQCVFNSDAPNPVSLRQITGYYTDRERLLKDIAKRLLHYLTRIDNGDFDNIHNEYKACLYRGTGMHTFEDDEGKFLAEISDVEENGHLVLKREDGRLSTYAFKEITFII